MSKNLVVYITKENGYSCNLATFNLLTEKEMPFYRQEVQDIFKFFDKPPRFVTTSVKAIIYGFSKNVDPEFSEKLAAKLKDIQIPFRFISQFNISAMCNLIGAKISDLEVDEEILQIYVTCEIFKLIQLIRTKNGYVIEKVREIKKNFNSDVLLDSSNPSKIIIAKECQCAAVPELQKNLSAWKLFIFKRDVGEYLCDAVKEIVDHIFDLESSKKYFVIPQTFREFGIDVFIENPSNGDVVLSIKRATNLPVTESCIVSRFNKNLCETTKSATGFKVSQKSQLINKEGHRIKLTLSIDLNTIPSMNQEAIILSKVKNMPKKLKIEKTEKLPIIGFFDYASVICVWSDENNCYKFLDSWNGKLGKDLFLDFMLPKPKFIDSATKITSFSGAVYDLIKIMSMPSDNVKIDSKWKFEITKNEDNPVLLEFDTFDENTRFQASPVLLMAKILTEHIRAIKNETGQKPTKLGFRLLDEFENPESRKGVETGLKEACGLIKIECLIV